jgi:hypothetical protein
MSSIERRAFIKGAALGALAFTVGGVEVMLTPSEARAQGVPLRTLTAEQAETLDALGETLVPGAKQAGITNFVDQQISGPAEEALLEARILNVKPPYANFYRAALGAVDRASQALNGGRRFAQLNEAERCSSDALPRPLSSRRRDRSRADWRAHRAKSFCNKICQNRKYSGSLIRARAHRSSRVLARRHDKVQSDQQKNLLNILNDSVISSRRVALVFMREECSAYSCDRSVHYHRTTR